MNLLLVVVYKSPRTKDQEFEERLHEVQVIPISIQRCKKKKNRK